MTTKQQSVNQSVASSLAPFTEVIKVEVDVQSIYEKLLSTFPEDYKHKEILSHAIIGTAKDTNDISYIYNALNGYSNDIDFKVGDTIMCETPERYEWYDANKEDESGKAVKFVEEVTSSPDWKKRMKPIGKCKVIDVNIYSSNKLTVSFEGQTYSGRDIKLNTVNVNHKKCTKWAPEVVTNLPA